MKGFVDTHSHMVPSGDDGVRSVDQAVELVSEAGRRGTAVQYATPHAMRKHPPTPERRRAIALARHQIRERLAGKVDFRTGWEVSPERWVLDADPHELRMEGLDAVLLELPLPHTLPGSLDLAVRCGEHFEAHGLTPIIGHPERCGLVQDEPAWAASFAHRGWLLQVNGSSLSGRHGRKSERLGWRLIEDGVASLVGSDGHRENRPPYLDTPFEAVCERVGRERALPLFTGVALEPLASEPELRAELG